MADKSSELVQGTLDMLEQISRDVFRRVNAGPVSGCTAAAASRIDQKRMERYREQPSSEVLHPD
jgi:hypothetical protein